MTYLEANADYWGRGYRAPNVDAPVFRWYGSVLRPDFGIDGSGGERLLDFGCGEGAAVSYWLDLGFDAYGVDISETDIDRGRQRDPRLTDRLDVIDPKPAAGDEWFGGSFDIVTSVQTLYYLSPEDLAVRLDSLRRQMPDDGVFYATMMRTDSYFFEKSTPADNGMRKVEFDHERLGHLEQWMTFTDSEDDLVATFPMFEPVHIGWYASTFRSREPATIHWAYTGQVR